MSDEYHTPKDLVNKQPLSIGLEVFEKDGGTVESYGSESFQRLNHTPAGDPSKVVLKLKNALCIYRNTLIMGRNLIVRTKQLTFFVSETIAIRSYLQRT